MKNSKENVILKGVASNILNMNVPTISVVNNMLKDFDSTLVSVDDSVKLYEYRELCKTLLDRLYVSGDIYTFLACSIGEIESVKS